MTAINAQTYVRGGYNANACTQALKHVPPNLRPPQFARQGWVGGDGIEH